MAQIWTETFDPKRHSDKMLDFTHLPGVPREQYWRAPTLQRYPVYFVRVCGFTFEFHSLRQLEVCLEFFSKKVRPSSMIRFSEADRKIHWLHWVCQRWSERLPMQLLEERRRVRIVPALRQALAKFRKETDELPNKGAAANRRPALRTKVIENLKARRAPHRRSRAAVAELDR
jgi:hypothetical protein